jgi:hypothetical protein
VFGVTIVTWALGDTVTGLLVSRVHVVLMRYVTDSSAWAQLALKPVECREDDLFGSEFIVSR